MPLRMGLGIKAGAFQLNQTLRFLYIVQQAVQSKASSSSSSHKGTSASLPPPQPLPNCPPGEGVRKETESKKELRAQGSCFRVGRTFTRVSLDGIA